MTFVTPATLLLNGTCAHRTARNGLCLSAARDPWGLRTRRRQHQASAARQLLQRAPRTGYSRSWWCFPAGRRAGRCAEQETRQRCAQRLGGGLPRKQRSTTSRARCRAAVAPQRAAVDAAPKVGERDVKGASVRRRLDGQRGRLDHERGGGAPQRRRQAGEREQRRRWAPPPARHALGATRARGGDSSLRLLTWRSRRRDGHHRQRCSSARCRRPAAWCARHGAPRGCAARAVPGGYGRCRTGRWHL